MAEGAGVREKEVWDDSSVIEKSVLLERSRSQNRTIHIAEIMAIASIKNWETPDRRRYKGRLVFRGDQVRDSWGGAAQFGEMYSTPTNIQSINVAIMYGMLVGHALTTADCTRAFLQAFLLTDRMLTLSSQGNSGFQVGPIGSSNRRCACERPCMVVSNVGQASSTNFSGGNAYYCCRRASLCFL